MTDSPWNPLNGCMVFYTLKSGWTIVTYPQDDIEPHFILFDKPYPDNSKYALISLFEPAYLNMDSHNWEKSWILTHEEKRQLCRILKRKNKHPYPGFSHDSIWHSILECYNNEVYPEATQVSMDLQKPNYMQLPEN